MGERGSVLLRAGIIIAALVFLAPIVTGDADALQLVGPSVRVLTPGRTFAETKVYVDPPVGRSSGGHTFNRRVNPDTLEREDSPEQIDSWNRTWAFIDWHLRKQGVPVTK